MFHRSEQKGTEPPALRIDGVNAMPSEDPREEFLREIARRLLVRRVAADEGKDRRVIGGAQIAQRGLRLGRVASCAQNERPSRSNKSSRRRRGFFRVA